MAKVSAIVKSKKTPKFAVRQKNRCSLCGRSRAYIGRFGICRLCFRDLAHRGELPGVTRATW